MMPVSSDFFTTLGSTIGYQRYIETGRGLFKSLAPLVMRLNMALGEPILASISSEARSRVEEAAGRIAST
jgi:hypothetical protein